MSLKSPYDAVLFDWDGTLVNSWRGLDKALDMTLEKMGTSMEELRKKGASYGHSLRDSFPIWFGDNWKKARDIYHESFQSLHLDYFAPFEESEYLLQELKRQNIYVSVVSNKNGSFLRDEVNHLGWMGYFHHVIGAGDSDYDKPHAAHIFKALPEGFQGRSCMVGDSIVDLQCARNANIDALLVFPEESLPDFFNKTLPDKHFLSLKAASDYLLSFDKS